MSTPAAAERTPLAPSTPPVTSRRIAGVRAIVAFAWAAAVLIAVGGDTLQTGSEVPTIAAALLATYPLIDVVASILTANVPGAAARVARVNAVISSVAVVAIGVAAFGSDAGAALATFGAWAAVSGALQLGVAVHARHEGRQIPMMISGGLSTVAGLSFIAAASGADANLSALGGYMAVGAVLSLVWSFRARTVR